MDGNGNGAIVKGCDGGTQTISISCAPGTQKLALDVDCINLDVALALLGRAQRELESRYRFQKAQELTAEAMEAARINQIARGAAAGRLHRV